MQELWRPVVGWESRYEVSNLGRIRSFSRSVKARNRWSSFEKHHQGKFLKQHSDKYGYKRVRLSGGDRKTFSYRRVHQLVAEAFIGPRPNGQMVRHGPLGKTDNSVSNLSYGTAKQNSEDQLRDGTSCRGIKNSHARLTDKEVLEIFHHPYPRGSGRRLAARYGVQPSIISKIRTGKAWSWLTTKS